MMSDETFTKHQAQRSPCSTTASSSSSAFGFTCSGLMVNLEAGGDKRDAALVAITGHIVDFSSDPLAYRVASRALSLETSPKTLANEVLGSVVPLSLDSCGHRALESAIEHGSVDQQHLIVAELLEAIARLSTHIVGHLVVRKALLCCPEVDQQAIANALLRNPSTLSALSEGQCGRQVAMTLLRLSDRILRRALSQLDCVSLASPVSQHAKEVLLALREHCADN